MGTPRRTDDGVRRADVHHCAVVVLEGGHDDLRGDHAERRERDRNVAAQREDHVGREGRELRADVHCRELHRCGLRYGKIRGWASVRAARGVARARPRTNLRGRGGLDEQAQADGDDEQLEGDCDALEAADAEARVPRLFGSRRGRHGTELDAGGGHVKMEEAGFIASGSPAVQFFLVSILLAVISR